MRGGRLGRLWQIHRIVHRYGLREFLDGKPRKTSTPRGERLRLALQELGPVFIKFGQALSTRPDIVPADIALELMKLQDQVPPFPGSEARAIIERALGKPVSELYAEFDETPMASASVAQVHAARLHPVTADDPGFEVVVKVIRPGIEKTIRGDIALMRTLAELATRFNQQAARLRPREIVAEFERIILDELDLMREGASCSQLRRNWLGSPLIYHPLVLWDYTKPDVLTMERIHGVSIRELAYLRELGVDFKKLSERGVEIFFKQVFRDNFFHADMHPGNIIVDASDPRDPRYLAIDFGIVGTLAPSDQRYLAENFLAFFNRDYRRIAELHLESGWIPSSTRVEDFEAAIRTISEPIFGRPIKDISFGFFLMRLFQVARRFDYQVQPQLVLLQKTLLQVEGLGRQLDPELDLWKSAKPIMDEWMRNRLGPAGMLERARAQLPTLAEVLPELATRALKQLDGSDAQRTQLALLALHAQMREGQRALRQAVVGTGLIIAAAIGFACAVTPWISAPVAAAGLLMGWRSRRRP